jgi:hypothetical protein
MKFRCELCEKSFVSGYALAEHFRSKEHRRASGEGRIESLMDGLVDNFKKSISDENKGETE